MEDRANAHKTYLWFSATFSFHHTAFSRKEKKEIFLARSPLNMSIDVKKCRRRKKREKKKNRLSYAFSPSFYFLPFSFWSSHLAKEIARQRERERMRANREKRTSQLESGRSRKNNKFCSFGKERRKTSFFFWLFCMSNPFLFTDKNNPDIPPPPPSSSSSLHQPIEQLEEDRSILPSRKTIVCNHRSNFQMYTFIS